MLAPPWISAASSSTEEQAGNLLTHRTKMDSKNLLSKTDEPAKCCSKTAAKSGQNCKCCKDCSCCDACGDVSGACKCGDDCKCCLCCPKSKNLTCGKNCGCCDSCKGGKSDACSCEGECKCGPCCSGSGAKPSTCTLKVVTSEGSKIVKCSCSGGKLSKGCCLVVKVPKAGACKCSTGGKAACCCSKSTDASDGSKGCQCCNACGVANAICNCKGDCACCSDCSGKKSGKSACDKGAEESACTTATKGADCKCCESCSSESTVCQCVGKCSCCSNCSKKSESEACCTVTVESLNDEFIVKCQCEPSQSCSVVLDLSKFDNAGGCQCKVDRSDKKKDGKSTCAC